MRHFIVRVLFCMLLAAVVVPAIGCGGEDDCSGNGANCRLIVEGTEPPCCEGLRCQDSLINPNAPYQVCR